MISLVFSILVMGASEGAVSAAVTAAESGQNVVLIADHEIGGMSAAGTGTMDGNTGTLESGFYKRFIDHVNPTRKTAYHGTNWGISPYRSNKAFVEMLNSAGVTVVHGDLQSVNHSPYSVNSVRVNGVDYLADYFIDGSETGDLITELNHPINPIVCKQKLTWSAPIKFNGIQVHRKPPHYDSFVQDYRGIVTNSGSSGGNIPVNPYLYYNYRKYFTGESALNWGNDHWSNDLVKAKYKTIGLLYYLQKELGLAWSLADQGLGHSNYILPSEWRYLESLMPGHAYYRQTVSMKGIKTIKVSDVQGYVLGASSRYRDSVAVGDYFYDSHGCYRTVGSVLTNGIKGVPYLSMVSSVYDNLIVANGKLVSTEEHANTFYRHQPVSMLIGQAAGNAASIAYERNQRLRDVSVGDLQDRLLDQDSNLIPYSDVPLNHPYIKHINKAALDGISYGIGGWKFAPDRLLSRAEMAVFLHRASGLPTKQYRGIFSDVSNTAWYRHSVQTIADAGITGGCGGGKFCPNNNVTNWQLNRFISRIGKPYIVPDIHNDFSTRSEIVAGIIGNE